MNRMPHETDFLLDQELKTFGATREDLTQTIAKHTQQFARLRERGVEILRKRLPTAPKSCFFAASHFLVAGGSSAGAEAKSIDPQYVLPLEPFQLEPRRIDLGFAIGSRGSGFVAVADTEGTLSVSPYLLEPQPTALDLDLTKLYEFIREKVKAEEATREIAPPATS